MGLPHLGDRIKFSGLSLLVIITLVILITPITHALGKVLISCLADCPVQAILHLDISKKSRSTGLNAYYSSYMHTYVFNSTTLPAQDPAPQNVAEMEEWLQQAGDSVAAPTTPEPGATVTDGK